MKSVLIVENRFKTRFWIEIVRRLPVTFKVLVQNHEFCSSDCEEIVLPYYRGTKHPEIKFSPTLKKKIETRRTPQDWDCIRYYYECISEVIENERPDVILCESTLTHELITIDVAKRIGIPCYNLGSSRYPKRKFLILLGDSLRFVPNIRNGLDGELAALGQDGQPDYMKPTVRSARRDWPLNLLAWSRGEKLNTPSPLFKLKQELNCWISKRLWDFYSSSLSTSTSDSCMELLFPVQMQPESNLDVWAYEFKNQVETIIKVSTQLRKGERLLVKSNPKMKYEILPFEMRQLKRAGVVFLPRESKMTDLLYRVRGVITVTGTVAYESLALGIPTLVFGDLPLPKSKNVNAFSDTQSFLEKSRTGMVHQKTDEIISFLDQISYDGLIGDASHNCEAMDEQNIASIGNKFYDAVLKG